MAEPPPKPAVVFCHGLWMTPLSWEHWITHFRSKGYEVLAPGWPGVDDRTPAQIRDDPKPMANKGLEEIVGHYASIIKALPTPPIIIGHSIGGLVTQVLLSQGYGCVGIGLCPGQPAGVFGLPLSTIKSTFPLLYNPFNYSSTVPISAKDFYYCFGNHFATMEESKPSYERYAIPGVYRALWEAALGGVRSKGPSYVDFKKADRAPMLLIAGTIDHIVPESVVAKGFAKYAKGPGQPVVELKVFEGRSHGIVTQEGWEEIADYAMAFAEKHMKK